MDSIKINDLGDFLSEAGVVAGILGGRVHTPSLQHPLVEFVDDCFLPVQRRDKPSFSRIHLTRYAKNGRIAEYGIQTPPKQMHDMF